MEAFKCPMHPPEAVRDCLRENMSSEAYLGLCRRLLEELQELETSEPIDS